MDFVIASLTVGSIYALVAVGFNVIYKSTDALNFAQGEWVMMGGMLAAFAYDQGLQAVWIACVMAPIAVAVVGALSDYLVVARIRFSTPMAITLVTVGLSLVSKSLIMLLIGKEPRGFPGLSQAGHVSVAGMRLPTQTIWVVGVTLTLMLATHLFFGRSRYGIAMRAAAADRTAAALVGIDHRVVQRMSFVVAAFFGGIAGALITPITLMTYDSGAILGFKGFCAAMFGGIGNLYGALLGGLLLGAMETLGSAYLSSQFKDAIAFTVLLVVLLVRPQGLLGGKSIEKI